MQNYSTNLLLAICVIGLCSLGPAQDAKPPAATTTAEAPAYTIDIEMRPSDKRPLALKPNERNPYEKRSAAEEDFNEADADSEEAKLREILTQLRVGGSSRGPNGLRILFGDMNLEAGMFLPQLLPNQNDMVKVTEVTEESLTLAWMDAETGVMTGRTMQLTYDLTPTIAYGLPGQKTILDSSGNPTPASTMGIMRLGKERKTEAAQLKASNSLNDVPREALQAGQ